MVFADLFRLTDEFWYVFEAFEVIAIAVGAMGYFMRILHFIVERKWGIGKNRFSRLLCRFYRYRKFFLGLLIVGFLLALIMHFWVLWLLWKAFGMPWDIGCTGAKVCRRYVYVSGVFIVPCFVYRFVRYMAGE